MKYTFIKDKKDGVIYSAIEGDIETEIITIEAETMEEAFAIADPDYIKRQEEQLEKLKAAYEASKQKSEE
jgi:hypothetical protein